MKVWIAFGIVALCIGIYLLLGEDKITNHPSSGKDIIAFGDSLVAGVGSDEGGGFVKMLSDDLGISIINLGVPGNTTLDGLARISDLDRYDPKVVILLLGGNDFLRKVPEEETFQNLGRIIDEIHKRGSAVILLGVRSGVLRSRHNERFEELSERYGTAYVEDILSGIFGQSELMDDSIHPNDRGYRIISDKIKPVLEGLI